MKRTRTWLLATSGVVLQRCDLQCVLLSFCMFCCFTVFEAVLKRFRRVVFVSSETPPPALTRWKRFTETASNTVKQQRIRQESKTSQFYSQNIKFHSVPIQTLVNCITAPSQESRSHAFNYFNYFLSSRAWATCGFARWQAAAIC